MKKVINYLGLRKVAINLQLDKLPADVDQYVAKVGAELEEELRQIDQALLALSTLGKSLRDFTDDEILDEIDADMNYWGIPQGEIESMRQDWRNRFLILRRER